jgi:hypothetical protein
MLYRRGDKESVQAGDELGLDLVEFNAQYAESTFDAWRTNGTVQTEHMKTWGRLKVSKHRPQKDKELESIAWALTDNWGAYSLSNRIEIVDDLTQLGRLDDARRLGSMISGGRPTESSRDAATMALLSIARHQADNDLHGARVALNDMRAAELAMVEARLGIQVNTGDTDYGRHNRLEIARSAAVADLVTRHEIALEVRHSPERALERMSLLAPFAYDDTGIALDDARGLVARELATEGYIEDAIRLANAISDDPASRDEKSRAYTDIGKAVRARHSTAT